MKYKILLNKFDRQNKKGQIWIETLIYTLIAFVIIGLVLSFVNPAIEKAQDKMIIEQSIGMMEDINSIFLSLIQGGSGNKRLIELGIKKGTLKIDGVSDKIIFEIESKHMYSEPGKDVYHGNILAHTKKEGKTHIVTLTSNYGTEYNITYQGKDEIKLISKASTPYKIFFSNDGKDLSTKTIIDIDIN
ncbi:hypothetical protein KAR52_02365 [Candidatus Pacearchaeota archaeon]|nr:hypothetical protein [Candidatus Pacearchaeota archaeon]